MNQNSPILIRQRAAALKRAFALALTAALTTPLPLRAQDLPDTIEPLQDVITTTTPALANLWIVLLLVGTTMILAGLYLIRRARLQQQLDALDDDDVQLLSPPPLRRSEPHREDPIAALTQSITQAQQSGALGLSALPSVPDAPLFSLRTDGPQRECPKCHRKYASWMVICPIDAEPLLDPPSSKRSAPRATRSHSRSPLERKRCPTCERRYEDSASFCAHDATPLVQDTAEDSAHAPSWTVCRSCGQERDAQHPSSAPHCACQDLADLTRLDPARRDGASQSIALTACPICRAYGSPGQTHCVHDNQLLIPLSIIQLNALPPHGYGTRRKLCPKCGARYSGAFLHCTQDGARLSNLQ